MIWSEYNINLIKKFNYSRRVLCCALAMELKFQSQESTYSRCFTYKRCREDPLHSVLALSMRLTVVAAELYQGCGKAL